MPSAFSSSRRANRIPVVLAALLAPALEAAVLTVVVVENRTSRPLARTPVIVEPVGGAAISARTNRAGMVTLQGLAAGAYLVRAERAGFATSSYGQRRPGEPGTPIVLEADGHFTAELRLARLGAVSGEVVDENEVGLFDVPVTVLAIREPPKPVATVRTDDRGRFRIGGLAPGRYWVRAGPSPVAGGVGFLPTYYGQTASAARAAPVAVQLDEETEGIRIRPLEGRLARLTGRLLGGAAERVLLVSETGVRETEVASGGRFEFGELEPGAYALMAHGGDRSGYVELVLGEEDRSVTLEMGPAPVVELRCLGPAGKEATLRGVSLFARRKGSERAAQRLQCGERALWEAGRWELGVLTPAEFYVASLQDADSRSLLAELRLSPGASTALHLVLSDKPASLEVRVRTPEGVEAAGAPVWLRALDPELAQRIGGVRTAQADHQGRSIFLGLPPGRYELVSSYQLRGREEADWPAGLATAITLEQGRQAEVELTIAAID